MAATIATSSADFNKYMFLAFTWSQSGNLLRNYVRGVTTTGAYPGGTWTGPLAALRTVLMGNRNDVSTGAPGTFGMAGLWTRALSLGEIADLYAAFKAEEPNAV